MTRVRIKDVAPRLVGQAFDVPTSVKIELVDRLTAAGVPAVEVSSFVRPDLVPGLADAADVFDRVQRRPGIELTCCVGNERGLRAAVDAGADSAWYLLSVDPGFAENNIGRTIEESLADLERMAAVAAGTGTRLGTYLIFAWGGPAGGPRSSGSVVDIGRRILEVGVDEWILADSSGYAPPPRIVETIDAAARLTPHEKISLQIHDARGMGIAGAAAVADRELGSIDTSLAGAGGHPAMPGVPGGCVCTEDLVQALDLMDVETGVDLTAVIDASRWFVEQVDVPAPGFVRHVGAVPRGAAADARGTFDWSAH
ncbi:hypothetical protein [Nocardioides luteus]|uniref:hypothetical protein n=1 Tax=Nocardioides luteus TaxID=1844 RepID=UPI0018C91A58|nr:hypothetical protein [Nocardioides luteus]MBG6099060.1 hydroxymethylglutaryl-CoA lyase [Nocardioides luteus]